MPPRSLVVVLAALALATALATLVAPPPAWPSSRRGATIGAPSALAPRPAWPRSRRGATIGAPSSPLAAPAAWRWPLRGRVVGAFRLTPRAPFAAGQRRGIDVSGPPGTAVRAACRGRVTFAGPVPRQGLAVTVRCGALVATYLRLGRLSVRAGARVAAGKRLGDLGASGRLRLGARRAADRRGYLDPLLLLRDPATSAPPLLGPAPRARRARRAPPPEALAHAPHRPALGSADSPRHLPWPAYPAIALIATALPVGGLVRRRRLRRVATPAAAAHEGP
ncbi:MAG TPA: M23 family metallopeptidase [Solirubrobacteraceae bacterium]